MAYATVEDLQARWRILSADEAEVAAARLDDASVQIRAWIGDAGEFADKYDDAAARLRIVCCNLAMRSMLAETDSYGINAGEQSYSWRPMAAAGDWYMRDSDWALLGLSDSGGSIGTASL